MSSRRKRQQQKLLSSQRSPGLFFAFALSCLSNDPFAGAADEGRQAPDQEMMQSLRLVHWLATGDEVRRIEVIILQGIRAPQRSASLLFKRSSPKLSPCGCGPCGAFNFSPFLSGSFIVYGHAAELGISQHKLCIAMDTNYLGPMNTGFTFNSARRIW